MDTSGYQAHDARTGVVLARAGTAEDALDQACDLLARQLHASGEGAGHVRYELTAYTLGAAGRCWAGTRIYYPGTICARPGPAWRADRTARLSL
jgi:hypothetical protein